MLKLKAMMLITALSLSIVLTLVSAFAEQRNASRLAYVAGSHTSSSLASSLATRVGAHPQSATAELQTVGGDLTCAGLAGFATGLALGALIGCGPLCLGLALGVVVVAAGC